MKKDAFYGRKSNHMELYVKYAKACLNFCIKRSKVEITRENLSIRI
mgnify:CR=1 FL=1